MVSEKILVKTKTYDWLLIQQREYEGCKIGLEIKKAQVDTLNFGLNKSVDMFNHKTTQYNLLWNDYEKTTGLLAKSERRKETFKRTTFIFGGIALFETLLIVLIGMVLVR